MTTVRISSDWGHPQRMDWCGAPGIDDRSRIERSLDLPEEAYLRIEAGIAQGYVEGSIFLEEGSRVKWFLDGPRPGPRRKVEMHQAATIPPIDHPAPKQSVPETPVPVRGPQHGPNQLIDVAEKPGQKLIHPTGDFQSGWVLAEFSVAGKPTSLRCPQCGQTLPHSAPHEEPT